MRLPAAARAWTTLMTGWSGDVLADVVPVVRAAAARGGLVAEGDGSIDVDQEHAWGRGVGRRLVEVGGADRQEPPLHGVLVGPIRCTRWRPGFLVSVSDAWLYAGYEVFACGTDPGPWRGGLW